MSLTTPVHRFLLLLLASALFALAAVSSAQADYGLEQVSLEVQTPAGEPVSQAASHPDVTIEFRLHETTTGSGRKVDDGQTRTVVTDLPVGMYANPQVVPPCDRGIFGVASLELSLNCPFESQVGTLTLLLPAGDKTSAFPLYSLAAPDGKAAALGANVVGTPVGFNATVTSEGGTPVIRSVVENSSQGAYYVGVRLKLWGNPANPVHNSERLAGMTGSGLEEKPFVTLPSNCARPMLLRMAFASWQEPTRFHEGKDELAPPTGCENLKIKHSTSIQPTQAEASQPSGFDISIDVPQNEASNANGTPPVRRVQVDFPTGVALSPGAADGLEGCSDQQLGLGSDAPPTCPAAAKVGSIDLETPLLAKEVTGSVYVGTSTPEHTFRVFFVIEGPGTLLKLPGIVEADPATGRLTAIFEELPELPFSSVDVHLDGGPGAPLSTPGCGTHTTTSVLTAWSGQVSRANSRMTIDSGCEQAGKFEPKLSAGLTNPVAGGPTAFSLRLTRPSGQQAISSLDVTLPPGLLAKVGSVPLCPEANAAAGTCPAGSQVGTVTVGAGDGSAPVYVPQPGHLAPAVYLAGPYKGAPYSLSIVVPAQAGPYDLGNVVVRSAVEIDPVTAQVSVDSDPFPTILKGIPLRLQDIRVDVNRPGFIVAPTNCEPMRVTSTVTSATGTIARPSSRFQAAECGNLGFAPKLSLRLAGGTERGDHPALRATLKMPSGGANIARTVVALPHSEFLAQDHIRTVCTRVQFAAGAGNGAECPAGSIYGKATATTPLLGQPLSGPVYLRSSNNPLPDLVVALHGPIDVDLVGRIDSIEGGIRTTFASVPDAPVSKFVLDMQGGKKGLLENSRNLCKSNDRADVRFTAQNGRSARLSPQLRSECGGKVKRRAANSPKRQQ
jgi:hypothetical protein